MEREISSGAMLGIVLLALAAVIGLGFGVFAITKGVANEGTVNVQDSLGTVSTQVFLDYDQKIVTGTQALSAFKTFEGKPYAVLIGTKALQQKGKTAPTHAVYAISEKATGKPVFINYNAVLAKDGSGATITASAKGGAIGGTPSITVNADAAATQELFYLENGAYIVSNGFASTSGNVVFDKESGGMYKAGNAEFVPTSAKFQANLIKDKSGNIMGVVLEQQ